MAAWTCPSCGRRFARIRQGHECAPALSLEEYFSTGPAHERPVFDAIVLRLVHLGEIHVEPVSVGIFLKRARTFAELRPMRDWVAVSFGLGRVARHPLIVRKVVSYAGGYFHVANVRGPGEVDDALLALLAEAYDRTPARASRRERVVARTAAIQPASVADRQGIVCTRARRGRALLACCRPAGEAAGPWRYR